MKLNKTEKKILKTIYDEKRYWFVGSLANASGVSEATVRKYIKTLAKKGLIILTKSMGEFKLQGYNTLRSYLGRDMPVTMRTTITIEECNKKIRMVEEILKD